MRSGRAAQAPALVDKTPNDASRLESCKSHKRRLKRLLLAKRSQSDASRLESCKSHKRRLERLLLSQFGGV